MWLNQFKPEHCVLLTEDLYLYKKYKAKTLQLQIIRDFSSLYVQLTLADLRTYERLFDLRDPSEDCFMYLELMQNTDELLDSQSIKEK